MHKVARGALRIVRRAAGYGLAGGVLALVATAVVVLERRPDLDVWHEARLDVEFTRHSKVADFAGYLALEERLFEQLEREVYQKTGAAGAGSVNRYQRGSRTDPAHHARDWNRTFEFVAERPVAAVLLLHGMSDSPYSLHHLGESLHARGATVVGLRLPGHGTAPSGLVRARWQDMAAAVRLAARHLHATTGGRPLCLVGYSNGGALAVEYALAALADPALPQVERIVMLSPAIGVSPAAALAVWQDRLGRWLGLRKLAWDSIALECDPFKYRSFAVNAGDQTYRLTKEVGARLDEAAAAGRLGRFPPVLAFQSAVDATVSTPALVAGLLDRLPAGGHELVLFDLNRLAGVGHLVADDPAPRLEKLLAAGGRGFAVSVVTNRVDGGVPAAAVVGRRREPGQADTVTRDLGLAWPADLVSLSHIALPFPPGDPVYGAAGADGARTLGNLALRGERGAIQITPNDMLRLRWNPFYSLVEGRTLEFLLPATRP